MMTARGAVPVLLIAAAASAVKHRNVTFWYTPAAYGGGDTTRSSP